MTGSLGNEGCAAGSRSGYPRSIAMWLPGRLTLRNRRSDSETTVVGHFDD